jgi:pyrroloquinoline quinone (PQQ) biosynthesis protein C
MPTSKDYVSDVRRVVVPYLAPNSAFSRWCDRIDWTARNRKIFAREYGAWVTAFPAALARLTANVRDDASRSYLSSILDEELGSGVPGRCHSLLLREVFVRLGLTKEECLAPHRFRQTDSLLEGMMILYGNSRLAIAIGAQFALEHQAVSMILKLKSTLTRAVRQAGNLPYFRIHLKAEPKHAKAMRLCLSQYVRTDAQLRECVRGAERFLTLINSFWERISEETLDAPRAH